MTVYWGVAAVCEVVSVAGNQSWQASVSTSRPRRVRSRNDMQPSIASQRAHSWGTGGHQKFVPQLAVNRGTKSSFANKVKFPKCGGRLRTIRENPYHQPPISWRESFGVFALNQLSLSKSRLVSKKPRRLGNCSHKTGGNCSHGPMSRQFF